MLEYKPLKRFSGTRKEHDREIRTVCRECTLGCGILAYTKGNRIVDIQGDEMHPVSSGRLCAKGTAFVQGLTHPQRLTHPLYRKAPGTPFQPMENWEKSLDILSEDLRKINARYGPGSLAIACAPEAGLEYYIGAMRFARLWGTPYVFHPVNPAAEASLPVGFRHLLRPSSDWINSRCLLFIEADLATTHPVAFQHVLDARNSGVKIIAADSKFTTTMSKADVALQIKPESGNALGLALMKLLLEDGKCDSGEDAASWKASFEHMSLDNCEARIGLSVEKLKEIAAMLGKKSPVTVITGNSLTNQPYYGIWLTLTTAMNWFGIQGGGWYPLDSGFPSFNPGAGIEDLRPLSGTGRDDEIPRATLEELIQAFQETDSPIKAIICSGNALYNFLSPIRKYMKQMDIAVYFGALPTATYEQCRMAFPATLWAERESICFSNDGAVQWGNQIVNPAEGCRSGLAFWAGLAKRFGDVKHLKWEDYFPWLKEDNTADHREFFKWLLSQTPDLEAYDIDTLSAEASPEASGISFWIKGESGCTEKINPVHAPSELRVIEMPADESYPLYFQNTRGISGEASQWYPWIKELEYENAIQINPKIAHALGIENGEEVLLNSPEGETACRAWLSQMVPEWMIWSSQQLAEHRALICKKGQTDEEALKVIKEVLSVRC